MFEELALIGLSKILIQVQRIKNEPTDGVSNIMERVAARAISPEVSYQI